MNRRAAKLSTAPNIALPSIGRCARFLALELDKYGYDPKFVEQLEALFFEVQNELAGRKTLAFVADYQDMAEDDTQEMESAKDDDYADRE